MRPARATWRAVTDKNPSLRSDATQPTSPSPERAARQYAPRNDGEGFTPAPRSPNRLIRVIRLGDLLS